MQPNVYDSRRKTRGTHSNPLNAASARTWHGSQGNVARDRRSLSIYRNCTQEFRRRAGIDPAKRIAGYREPRPSPSSTAVLLYSLFYPASSTIMQKTMKNTVFCWRCFQSRFLELLILIRSCPIECSLSCTFIIRYPFPKSVTKSLR